MASDITYEYGKSQVFSSPRMRKYPTIGKLIYKVFGYTSIGNWARANVFIDRLKLLPMKDFKKIMDLGAGLGEFTFMMAEAHPDKQITALEIAPDRIALLQEVVAKQKYKNVTVFPDYIANHKDDNSYDFIFSIDVFEHILKEQMPFEEAYRKLKPGGYLMVKMPNVTQIAIFPNSWFEEHNKWLEDEHIGQVYNLDQLVDRFKQAGFTIEHASYSDGWVSRLGWEISYFSAKGGSVVQLAFLPLVKFIYLIERMTFRSKKNGNCIQVIGRK